jgi:hypothetical protein
LIPLNKKAAGMARGIKSQRYLSASRRDSRKPFCNKATHTYEKNGFAESETVNHRQDYIMRYVLESVT